jgi:integrase
LSDQSVNVRPGNAQPVGLEPTSLHAPVTAHDDRRSAPPASSLAATSQTRSHGDAFVRRPDSKGVRLHDLRHTFSSDGLLVGEGLPMIGKLLGHTQIQTTARYAHLADTPIKTTATRISSRLAAALGSPEGS